MTFAKDNDVIRITSIINSRRQFLTMKTTTQSIERFQEFLKNGSRKRRRPNNPNDERLPPRKRRRLMSVMPPTYYEKVKKWQERKRRFLLGSFLHARAQKQKLEEQTRKKRRLTRKRSSSEKFADYEGISKCKYAKKIDTTPILNSKPILDTPSSSNTKPISYNTQISDTTPGLVPVPKRHGLITRLGTNDTAEVKVDGPAKRRKRWRKADEKRF